jgi:hypothetical protein
MRQRHAAYLASTMDMSGCKGEPGCNIHRRGAAARAGRKYAKRALAKLARRAAKLEVREAVSE